MGCGMEIIAISCTITCRLTANCLASTVPETGTSLPDNKFLIASLLSEPNTISHLPPDEACPGSTVNTGRPVLNTRNIITQIFDRLFYRRRLNHLFVILNDGLFGR